MDSKLKRVFAWFEERRCSDPEWSDSELGQDLYKKAGRIPRARHFAEQFRKYEIAFSDFSTPSTISLSTISESVDDNIPWQAGRDLCEVFDCGLGDELGFESEYEWCRWDLRVLSPVWCAEQLKILTAPRLLAGNRLSGGALEPADPQWIQQLQSVVDFYKSSTDQELTELDGDLVRTIWWTCIKIGLTKIGHYSTRLGTHVNRHWPVVEKCQRALKRGLPEATNLVKDFPGDNKQDRDRLRLQTAARIQAAACEIVAECFESTVRLNLDTVQRYCSLMDEKYPPPSSKSSDSQFGASSKGKKQASGRKRGRPKGKSTYDSDLDRRIWEAWKGGQGQYTRKSDMDRHFQVKTGYCEAAIDRERKRRDRRQA